jgi:hypothetical protein
MAAMGRLASSPEWVMAVLRFSVVVDVQHPVKTAITAQLTVLVEGDHMGSPSTVATAPPES